MTVRQEATTVEALKAMGRSEALALFSRLSPPDALAGEFAGHIPSAMEADWRSFVGTTGIGDWLGKAYLPEPSETWAGHGYNLYRRKDRITRQLRFAWRFGSSVLDGKPSLVMRYSAFDNWGAQQHLTDEVRQVQPGLLLGVYFTAKPVPGFTPREGADRTGPELFVLTGPVGPWQGAERD